MHPSGVLYIVSVWGGYVFVSKSKDFLFCSHLGYILTQVGILGSQLLVLNTLKIVLLCSGIYF